MEEFVNFTPHNVNVVLSDGTTIVIPRSGMVVLLNSVKPPEDLGTVGGGIPIKGPQEFDSINITTDNDNPDECYRKFHEARRVIVSSKSAEFIVARKLRKEVYAPSMEPGDTVRDKAGAIIGIRALTKHA
jgi:hypothetical protein